MPWETSTSAIGGWYGASSAPDTHSRAAAPNSAATRLTGPRLADAKTVLRSMATDAFGQGGKVQSYGGGHEGKDTESHFTGGAVVPTGCEQEGWLDAQEGGRNGAGDMQRIGVAAAPRYGTGHEDLDTKDNFGQRGALIPTVDAGRHGTQRPRYGAAHINEDTRSNLDMGSSVPLSGPTYIGSGPVKIQSYGGGHEDKDTAHHFKGQGMNVGGQIAGPAKVTTGGNADLTPSTGVAVQHTSIADKGKNISVLKNGLVPEAGNELESDLVHPSLIKLKIKREKNKKAYQLKVNEKGVIGARRRPNLGSKKTNFITSNMTAFGGKKKGRERPGAAKMGGLAKPIKRAGGLELLRRGYVPRKNKAALDLEEARRAQQAAEKARVKRRLASAKEHAKKRGAVVKSVKDGGWWPEAAEEDLPVHLAKPRRASAVARTTATVVADAPAGIASGENDADKGKPTADRVLPGFAAFAGKAKRKVLFGNQNVQVYGNSTDMDDLTDHFDQGMQLGEDGALSRKEMYGGSMGHNGKDTFSHLEPSGLAPAGPDGGAIPERVYFGGARKGAEMHDRDTVTATQTGLAAGQSTDLFNGNNVVAPHYGHGHEDKDTFDHFEDGMNLGVEGQKSTKEMYGGHVGGSFEGEGSRSHLGVGLIPRPASPPQKLELPRIGRGPTKHFAISHTGYVQYGTPSSNAEVLVDPEKRDGARAKMVFPGLLVSRPETIDAADHDARYQKYSTSADRAEYDEATHTARKDDGFAVKYPGYRAAPKEVSTVAKSGYMQKWAARQAEGLGDLRGGRFHQGQGGKAGSTKNLIA